MTPKTSGLADIVLSTEARQLTAMTS